MTDEEFEESKRLIENTILKVKKRVNKMLQDMKDIEEQEISIVEKNRQLKNLLSDFHNDERLYALVCYVMSVSYEPDIELLKYIFMYYRIMEYRINDSIVGFISQNPFHAHFYDEFVKKDLYGLNWKLYLLANIRILNMTIKC